MDEFYDQFNYRRYTSGSVDTLQSPGEEFLGKAGMRISFRRIATQEDRDTAIHFKSFVTNYNETFLCEWEAEKIYGRSDAVPIYSNTRRKLSLGFAIPAINNGEAYENLAKVQKLIQFLYPSYRLKINDSVLAQQTALAQIVTRSPMVRLKMMNMIQNMNTPPTTPQRPAESPAGPRPAGSNSSYLYNAYAMNQDDGLLGIISNFIVLHHMGDTSGVAEKVQVSPSDTNASSQLKAIMPRLIEINLDFEPVHEHPLGWDLEGNFGTGTITINDSQNREYAPRPWPFGVFLAEDPPAPDVEIESLTEDPEAVEGAGESLEDSQEDVRDVDPRPETEEGSDAARDEAEATTDALLSR